MHRSMRSDLRIGCGVSVKLDMEETTSWLSVNSVLTPTGVSVSCLRLNMLAG